ncbi:MAG: aspartate carbamoyltransferase catalytic subunit [Armatimonadetes bacterium]|nr:aspartate carbamoyltransferase catalytic subunit [Armatimonadota bacterium]
MRHLLSLRELSAEEIETLLDAATAYAEHSGPLAPALRGRTVATLFYEPSTRTEISFELAAKRLGADVVRCDVDRSSVCKGESLLDTVRTLEALGADAIIIRHSASGAPYLASTVLQAAVVNAGDGMHEHPTQGLLDLLTVRQRLGRIAGLRIAIVGDIRHSRVARSAAWGFSRLGAKVTLVGPATLLLPDPEALPARCTTSVEDGLRGADVVMVLRMQLERQAGGDVPSVREYAAAYGLTEQLLAKSAPGAIVMHPGPVNPGIEVRDEVASGPRSVIAQQVTNGIFVRMAALVWALERELPFVDSRSSFVDTGTRPTTNGQFVRERSAVPASAADTE